MLLAEALAARKDAITEIDGLRVRLAAAVVRYEDQEQPEEDPAALLAALGSALDRFESLAIRINRTNNATRLSFDGRDLTVMEAIAVRERLTIEAKARRTTVEALDLATGSARGRRGWLATRRTKDEIREVPTVEPRAERQAADAVSGMVRRLDMVLQQRNWTTELLE